MKTGNYLQVLLVWGSYFDVRSSSLVFEGFFSDYILSKTAGQATCLRRVELRCSTSF